MTKDALLRGVTHRLLRLSSFMCAQGNVNSHVDGFADVHYVEWEELKTGLIPKVLIIIILWPP